MDPLTLEPRNKQERDTPALEAEERVELEEKSEKQTEPSESSFFTEVFKFALLAFVIVVPFRIYIAQPFIVSGASMSPTFETGEYLIVDQLSYRFEEPQRGDVVIFKFPNDPSKFFIKRIIGLPGEIVQLANGETTIITPDNKTEIVLDEEYLITDKTDDHLSISLSSNEYFVMGDNRSASSDSRVWGPVPRSNIVGKALVRLLPIAEASVYPGAYMYTPSEIRNTAPNTDVTQ
jgi:signal peptidase I